MISQDTAARPCILERFLWPPLCTLTFTDKRGKLFGRYNHLHRGLDLASTLMLKHPYASRVVYFGLSSRSSRWRHWDESAVKKIERLIRYDFEYDDYRVSIERLSSLGGACTTEFRWRLAIRPQR